MSGYDFYELTGNAFDDRDSIDVVYNGTKYTLPYTESPLPGLAYYGATIDDNDDCDFSTYPLMIEVGSNAMTLYVPKDTPLPITISAGCMETTQAVWSKVGAGGGGGSTLPKITASITATNDGCLVYNNVAYDGAFFYDKDGNVIDDISSWEDTIEISQGDIETVTFYACENDGKGGTFYGTNPWACITPSTKEFIDTMTASDEVNCEYDSLSNSIVVTDSTQDSSISLSVSFEGLV